MMSFFDSGDEFGFEGWSDWLADGKVEKNIIIVTIANIYVLHYVSEFDYIIFDLNAKSITLTELSIR